MTTREICNSLGLAISSVNKKIKFYYKNNETIVEPKKNRRKKLDDNRSQIIKEIVQNDNTLTQRSIFLKLNEDREDNITRSYLSKLLKKSNILRKKLKLRTTNELNENLVIKKKITQILLHFNGIKIFFFDETGFNLHISTNYRYNLIGVDAIKF